MFPYDPIHQTFLNVYEGETLTSQAILDRGRPPFEYFAGTRRACWPSSASSCRPACITS